MELIDFLTSNKAALVGAVATLGEVLVIVVNTYRKLRANKKRDQQISTLEAQLPRSTAKDFLWTCNPINVFRKA